MKILLGICPVCQSEVVISRKSKTCIEHAVCNKDGLLTCEGSINTEPEVVWELETEDDDFLTAQSDERRIDFRAELEERMLQNELIDEIDLGEIDRFDDNKFQTKRKSKMTDSEIANDIQAGTKEWSREYDRHIQNPPQPGDILKASSVDSKVLLVVELAENNPPFIYGRAFVPEIVGQPLGWYLQDSTDGQNFHGWKCILLPRARTELIRKFGCQNETMEVNSLRVIRLSQSGKSLLCEVHDYGIEESKVEEAAEPIQVEVQEEQSRVVKAVVLHGKPVQDEEVTEDKEAQKPELTLGN